MPVRQLGKNGPKVSAISYGAMGLSTAYGTAGSDEERFKVLDRAIELGSTYFDSADIYGDNEDLLGKYFKKYPQQRQKVSRKIFFETLNTIFLSTGISCNKICWYSQC
jgi:aryl-alcohol dehydrogenase-like predicted oxidoreductase